jgi:peptidyl-prolyl cis-trans isomerase SurA
MAFSSVRRFVLASSRNFLVLSALLVAGAALLTGCHKTVSDPNDPKFIVAEKGTWQILRGELDTEVASFLKQRQTTAEQVGPSKMPMLQTMMLKNLVLKKLLLDRAAALNLPDTSKAEAAQLDSIKQSVPPGQDFDAQLKASGLTLDDLKKMIHERVVEQNVLEADAFKNVDPTEQEINDVYVKNKDAFNIPGKIRASRILIHVDDTMTAADKTAKKKAIDKAHDRVMHGEDFSKVASAVSEDRSSALKGGDLGFFQKGENPDAGFDEVVFATKQNTVSPVFLTPLGYQFVKVTAIQPPGVVPVADARGYISSKLREQKMGEQEQADAKKLLDNSGVTYHFVLVDPPAQQPQGAPGAPPAPDNAPPAATQDSSAPVPAAASTTDTNNAPAK